MPLGPPDMNHKLCGNSLGGEANASVFKLEEEGWLECEVRVKVAIATPGISLRRWVVNESHYARRWYH